MAGPINPLQLLNRAYSLYAGSQPRDDVFAMTGMLPPLAPLAQIANNPMSFNVDGEEVPTGEMLQAFPAPGQDFSAGYTPVERGMIAPLGTYHDGSTGLALPGILGGYGIDALGRASQAPRGSDREWQALADAGFEFAGAATTGGLGAAGMGMADNALGSAGGRLASSEPLALNALERSQPRVRAYHGTNSEFDTFDPSFMGSRGQTEEGAFFFGSPRLASEYADGEFSIPDARRAEIYQSNLTPDGRLRLADYNRTVKAERDQTAFGRVIPADIDTSNFASRDFGGYRWDSDEGAKLRSAIEAAKSEGRSGLSIQGMTDATGISDPQFAVWGRGTVTSPTTGEVLFANAPSGASVPLALNALERAGGRKLDPLGYYSQLDEVLGSLNPKDRVTLDTLRKRGVKEAELEARGVLDMAKAGAPVADLRAAAGEGVRLNERQYIPHSAASTMSNDDLRGVAGSTKWSAHSLDPSNPTYRETVLHLPSPADDAEAALRAKYGSDYMRKASSAELEQIGDIKKGEFRKGHFPEPNIVGHMMTSRTKYDGKPVYTVDQIQSDWGQKLRDGGVRDEAKIAGIKSRIQELQIPTDDEIASAMKQVDNLGFDTRRAALTEVRRTIAAGQDWRKQWDILPGDEAAADVIERAARTFNDRQLLTSELATAEASASGHPLVNTTDQWTNTTLRRALSQAAEAGDEYIAIPTGDTVLSYNPGDDAGMKGFYGSKEQRGIVPKNLAKILEKLDPEAARATYVDQLETTQGPAGLGFSLFPLTEKARAKIKAEGLPLFANAPSGASVPLALNALERAGGEAYKGRMFNWTDKGLHEAKLGDAEVTYGVNPDARTAELTLLRVPAAKRGQGQARAALNAFVQEADANGYTLTLNADPLGKGGLGKAALERFYKSAGFVRNKGRNKDFTTKAEYIRQPKASANPSTGAVLPLAMGGDEYDPETDPLLAAILAQYAGAQ